MLNAKPCHSRQYDNDIIFAKEKTNKRFFVLYKPGGADPHASHRNGVLIPAVNISFGDTILTFNGFTVQTTKEIESKEK